MRAAYIEELGPPGIIRYGSLPDPSPAPHEVLVRVIASAVNHVDTFVRSGAWRTPVTFPFVIGRDLVGTVVATGSSVTGFRAGEAVWCNSMGHAGRGGAAAELVPVPEERLYRLPDGVNATEAAAVAHPATTAYLGLFTHGRLRSGETVLVSGAAGNVGSALVVLAAVSGAEVIAVAAQHDADHCRSLGAAHVIDYRSPDMADRISECAPDGVDLYVDTSARNDLDSAIPLLAGRGRVVLMSGLSTRPKLPVGELYLRDRSVHGFAISHARGDELAEAAAEINRLTGAGELRPNRVEELPLDSAATAHRRLEEGSVRGKLVLRISDE
ncbi:NADPH:quinone reductase-like Zn-dependent oxidoreductase [Actinopolyspora lacussalsi]|nr:NADPH:quinone reductase-like Zn-dependent oxidoreductase [Actinopolyspora lacussalsi]